MTESKIRDCVATKLRQYRNTHDLTQKEMAAKILVSRQAYFRIEARQQTPDILLLFNICDVLDIQSVEELFKCPNIEHSQAL